MAMVVAEPPEEEPLPEYALPDLLAGLHSPDESQRHTALFMLSELLSFAYGEDGRLLGEALRLDLSPLIIMLADPFTPVEVTQQVLLLLGNLCSDAVDSESYLTKAALLTLGAERFLFKCLESTDDYIVLFACGVLQNVCHDPEWSKRVISFGLMPRLEAMLHHPNTDVVRAAPRPLSSRRDECRAPPPAPSRCSLVRAPPLDFLHGALPCLHPRLLPCPPPAHP